MRTCLAILLILSAVPALAQESEPEEPVPDYSRPALRSILLEAAREGEAETTDPFKTGLRLFEFQLGNSKTTVRFLPFGGLLPGQSGVEINWIPDPFALTGTAGSAMNPRMRSRFQEWRINRQLGFPIAPPKE
ncbi:MAG TPA: hypothetical protein VM557_06880 [Thermoanaerobaculia bacterium]|nr:hypothetical protein [Thermoanaerobaculia bacterium]